MRDHADLQRLVVAGSISGLVVLGVGGRLLMRGLAYLTPESPRFSVLGTAEVIGLGLVWGAVTAPILPVLKQIGRGSPGATGLLHGTVVFVTALVGFLVVTGGVGRLVAPRSFIVLGVILFPLLFLAHGVAVAGATSRDKPRRS